MKERLLWFLIFFVATTCTNAQGRVVFNNDAYLVIDNGAIVVLDNANTNAITEVGSGGRIVSENENDRLKWNIGTATGTYTVPFSTAAGVEFPFVMSITTAGVGAGNITFSTYNGPTWDNNTYRPSDVTHMLDLATGSVNNSNNVIDRFWIIDPLSYTTKPAATFAFTYIDAEHTPVGNTIVESDLGAQRFNTPSGIWGDYLPAGTINTVTNNVSGVPVTSANFFRSWTLSEVSNPLPLNLLNYTVVCGSNNSIDVEWTVVNQENIAEYKVMASVDGIAYTHEVTVESISTNGTIVYHTNVPGIYKYCKLLSVNTNGQEETLSTQAIECNGNGTNVNGYIDFSGNIWLDLTLNVNDNVKCSLVDAAGKLIYQTGMGLIEGRSQVNLGRLNLETGLYFLTVHAQNNNLQKTIKLYSSL